MVLFEHRNAVLVLGWSHRFVSGEGGALSGVVIEWLPSMMGSDLMDSTLSDLRNCRFLRWTLPLLCHNSYNLGSFTACMKTPDSHSFAET